MTRVTAFILARAGSKGLPRKNVLPFLGKPLIAHSIDHARQSGVIDDVIVSTDGEEIADVSRAHGAEVMMRPDALATDTAMPKDAILYHLEQMAQTGRVADIMVLLQPTSPLRLPEDVEACVRAVRERGFDSAATFVRSPSSPFRAWLNEPEGPRPFIEGFDPWKPRQALPETFALNGAVYAARVDIFAATPGNSFLPGRGCMVVMPPERSVDIDHAIDLLTAEAVARATGRAGANQDQ